MHSPSLYTSSHPENDRDVTEHAKGYTLQDESFMRESQESFFECLRKHERDNKHLPVECALTSRSFSRRDKVYTNLAPVPPRPSVI